MRAHHAEPSASGVWPRRPRTVSPPNRRRQCTRSDHGQAVVPRTSRGARTPRWRDESLRWIRKVAPTTLVMAVRLPARAGRQRGVLALGGYGVGRLQAGDDRPDRSLALIKGASAARAAGARAPRPLDLSSRRGRGLPAFFGHRRDAGPSTRCGGYADPVSGRGGNPGVATLTSDANADPRPQTRISSRAPVHPRKGE
jgi:hypothetical protein